MQLLKKFLQSVTQTTESQQSCTMYLNWENHFFWKFPCLFHKFPSILPFSKELFFLQNSYFFHKQPQFFPIFLWMNPNSPPQRKSKKRQRYEFVGSDIGIKVGGIGRSSDSIKQNQRVYLAQYGITRRKVFNIRSITPKTSL